MPIDQNTFMKVNMLCLYSDKNDDQLINTTSHAISILCVLLFCLTVFLIVEARKKTKDLTLLKPIVNYTQTYCVFALVILYVIQFMLVMVAVCFLFDAVSFWLVHEYGSIFFTFNHDKYQPAVIMFVNRSFELIGDISK